jgi:YYY domain-containing protein
VIHVFVWWLAIQLLSWLALPAVYAALRWLPDRGYSFAKAAGLLLAGYFLWIGASTGFLYNDAGGVLAALLALGGISLWLWIRRPGLVRSLPAFLRRERGSILAVEALFLAAFLAWAALRAYTTFPRIANAGGEKFMEMAFLTGVLNSPTFPPIDPWLSGFGISYYYFGYILMGLMTRLANTPVDVAFDLYDALTFALTASGAFGVVYNLVASRGAAALRRGSAAAAGVLGAILVTVLGNLSGLLESLHTRGLLGQGAVQWLNLPDFGNSPITGSWAPANPPGWVWWWRASRVIQDYDLQGNPIGASPIDEFPFFSFLLGDNHPHKLALPFVLLAVGLAFNLLRRQLAHPPAAEPGDSPWRAPLHFVLDGDRSLFLFYALALGALGFLNTWDMPIYLGLAALAYGLGLYLVRPHLSSLLAMRTAALALGLLLSSLLFYSLFFLGFRSQAGGVLPYVFPPTRLPQYLVMFGSFIAILLPFLAAQARAAGASLVQAGKTWLLLILLLGGAYLLLISLAAAAVSLAQISGSPESAAQARAFLGGLEPLAALGAILLARLRDPWLFLLLTLMLALGLAALRPARTERSIPDAASPESAPLAHERSGASAFVLLLILVSLSLTFITEFAYLRDIFGTRMNTIFKFYFQGWVLLGLASAYAVWWLLNPGRAVLGAAGSRAAGLLALVAIGAGLFYPFFGSLARSGGFQGEPVLNASIEIAQGNPDDWAAIQYLRHLSRLTAVDRTGPLPASVPIILEAPADQGGQYRYEGRISVFTGLPTLLGWAGHQTQWRGDYSEQARREGDIALIYTTPDAALAVELLRQWGVEYVIVGGPEIGYISRRCAEPARGCSVERALHKFQAAFEPVFQSGQLTIYRTP